jgi:hypothetical protein
MKQWFVVENKNKLEREELFYHSIIALEFPDFSNGFNL